MYQHIRHMLHIRYIYSKYTCTCVYVCVCVYLTILEYSFANKDTKPQTRFTMITISRLQAIQTPRVLRGQTIFTYNSTLSVCLEKLPLEELRAMDPRFGTIKKTFEETGSNYHSTSTDMYINLQIPPSYFHLNSPDSWKTWTKSPPCY